MESAVKILIHKHMNLMTQYYNNLAILLQKSFISYEMLRRYAFFEETLYFHLIPGR